MSDPLPLPAPRVRDVRFLREYAAFSCRQPVAVSEALFAGLSDAYSKRDYDRVAYLLLGLHAEMIHAYEAAGAMLLALSEGAEPGGVIAKLWSYGEGEVAKFLQGLAASGDWLAYVGLPEEAEVTRAFGEPAREAGYSHEGLKALIGNFVRMYTDHDVRGAYNKIKHGLLVVRHPDLLSDDPGAKGPVMGDSVYLLLHDKLAAFPVSDSETMPLAFKYLSNVRGICRLIGVFASFAASCLEAGLHVGRPRQVA